MSHAKAQPQRIVVISPTYNEAANVPILIEQVHAQLPQADILIVDDNSPDGTAQRVRELSGSDSKLHLLFRQNKQGFGPAYIAGFHWALQRDYDAIIQMDADLSHDPSRLPHMVEALQQHDLVIGSRYVAGGGVKNWPWHRRLLSHFANFYARTITGLAIADCTSGYAAMRVSLLRHIDLERVTARGYLFLVEMKYRLLKQHPRVCELPILFVEREQGRSKMSFAIVWEAVCGVFRLKKGG